MRSPACGALALVVQNHRRKDRFTVDGDVVHARVLLVSCNAYTLDLFSIGERESLDEGRLHLYVPHGLRRVTWEERSAASFTIDAPRKQVRAAIDGEPARLETPLEVRIEPRALRVLLPPVALT